MRYDILIDPPSYQVQLAKNNGHITKEKRRFNVSSLISSPKRSHKIPSFRSKTRETLLPKEKQTPEKKHRFQLTIFTQMKPQNIK